MLKIITDELAGNSSVLRECVPVVLNGKAWQISWRFYYTQKSTFSSILVNTQAYTGTGGPPGWGSTWYAGMGNWSNGSNGWAYETTTRGGGSWRATPVINTWHKGDLKYIPGKGVLMFIDNVQIGTCNFNPGDGLIVYICAYLGVNSSMKDLVFLDNEDLLLDDYTVSVVTGSYYSIPSLDECSNSFTVNGDAAIAGTVDDGGYLNLPNGSSIVCERELVLGGDDFTIDYWGSGSLFFGIRNDTNWLQLEQGSPNGYYGTKTYSAHSLTQKPSSRVHIAYVYEHSKGTVKIYQDGVLKATKTATIEETTYTSIQLNLYTSSGTPSGTVKNFRISKGIARWTAAFAGTRLPATANGPTFQETVCLPMNGQDEGNGTPMIVVGSPIITENSIKSGTMIYLNGSSRLTFDNFSVGASDFTIDFWTLVNTSSGSWSSVVDMSQGTTEYFRFARSGTSTNFSLSFESGSDYALPANSMSFGVLTHVAIVYNHASTLFKVYVNGKVVHTVTKSFVRRNYSLHIGYSGHNQTYINGYISDFRLSTKACWTENFPMYNQAFTKDSYTVALCHFTSSPTADDCGNTWSVVGTPAIINGELSLDGSSYLQLDGGIDIGGQDFTVEAWVCVRQYTGYRRVWHIGNTLSKNDITLCNNNTAGTFWWSTNGTNIITGTNYWNQRVHVAQVYKHDKGKSYYYVNGTLVGTTTNTIARYHAQYVWLGRGAYTDAYMVGQIKEFRVSDGIARYNHTWPMPAQNFPDGTPGTRYVKDPHTKILVHGNNACFFSGNAPNTDWCGNVFNYCKNLTVTTDHAKFTNALYIQAHQSWLKTTTPAFNFTGQDFTVDFWAYTITPAAYGSNVPSFFSFNTDIHRTPYPRLALQLTAATTLNVCTRNLSEQEVRATASITMINTLNHYAVTYSAGTIKVYINGVLKVTLTANLEVAKYYVCIGVNPATGNTNVFGNQYSGYISEFRISNNVCRWTDTFTPPTEAYTVDTNTWSLLHFNSVTADACSNATWEQFCIKPTFSTTVVPFPNSSSVYFAQGAQLRCDSFKLGGADYTIEGWAYVSSTQGAYARIFEHIITPGTGSHGVYLYRNNTSAGLILAVYNSSNSGASCTVSVTDNAWFHWAVVQEYAAGTTKLYINGEYKGVAAKVIDRVSREFVIGRSSWVANGPFVGYMTDFHVTDGVAKYKKNFQPPLALHYYHGKNKDSTTTGTNPGSTVDYSHAGVKDIYGSTTDSQVRDHGNQYVYNSYMTENSTGVLQRNALSAAKQKTGGLVTQRGAAKYYMADKTGIRVRVPTILNTTFDYNGAAQSPILKDVDYDKVSVTNFVATAAGTYDLTLALKNVGYLWTMGHKDPIIKQWIINTTISLSATDTILLNPSVNKATFTYTAPVSSYGDTFQNVTVSSNNTAVCTAELSGTTITVWRKGTGSATITVQGVMNGYTHKITRAVTVSAIDDATVSYMKFNSTSSPWVDLITTNTWIATNIGTCYYGSIIANKTQAFDLTKDWEVSFTYKYVSGAASDWNNIFAWGPHYSWKSNDSCIPIFSAGGNYNNYSSDRTAIRTFKAVYNSAAGTLTRTIDGVETVTNTTYTQTSYSYFYIGAGGMITVQTFYLKNLVIKAYLAGATTQSEGNYPFTNGSLAGTGDIAITTRSASLHTDITNINSTNARQGTALQIPTAGSYIQSNNTVPIADTDFTVEFWGYMDNATSGYGGFFMLSPNSNGSQAWHTANRIAFERLNGTDNLTLDVLNGSASSVYPDNTNFNCSGLIVNKLNHYAFVYSKDTATLKFYLNGVLKFTRTSCTIPAVARYMFIGQNSHTKFVGTVDEFRISNFMRYNGNFTPLTTAYDLVGPSTLVTVPSGNVGYTGSPVQPAYNTDTTVVDIHNNIEVLGGNKTATYRLKDTVNCCWPDGTITPKTVTYAITTGTKDANYYDTRCTTDLGNISANTVVNLSTLSTAGQNEFEYVDNTFRSGPSSYNVGNGQSNYWIKVTPTVNMTVNVTAQVGSENNWDFGLISVATSRSIPGRGATSITNGSIIMRGTNVVAKNTWSYNMTAGTTYWVGFHYAKDGTVNSNGDRLWIHGVNFT